MRWSRPDALRAERDALADEVGRLRRSVEELQVLNEVALALGAAGDVAAMLRALVQRALAALDAEEGVIALVEEGPDEGPGHARTLVRTRAFTTLRSGALRLADDDPLLGWMHAHPHPLVLGDPRLDPRFAHAAWPPAVRSVLAVPMLVGGRLVGVLTLYNKRAGGAFGPEDARLLAILAAQSAQVVEAGRLTEERARAEAERERAVRAFGEHTAPAVVEALLRGGAAEGPGHRQRVCVMFLDLRGFTARAEARPPEETVAFLNAFFDLTIAAVTERGGVVHQLLGDGFMALWGAPVPSETDGRDAVAAARAIVEEVEAAVADGRLPETRVGIGLHAGEAVAGMVGSAAHREYKVTGDVVNVAARIEKLNKAFDAKLLVSEAVWDRLDPAERPPADALGEVALDGRAGGVRLYRLA